MPKNFLLDSRRGNTESQRGQRFGSRPFSVTSVPLCFKTLPTFEPQRFLVLLQHFIVIQEDPDSGAVHRIIAGYHQYRAVNAAAEETEQARLTLDVGIKNRYHFVFQLSKLDQRPLLKRLYNGYAFSIDDREARGYAYMLYDQVVTEGVNPRPQVGACLHCHASPSVLYRQVGLVALGQPSDPATLAADFNMEAVIKGFEILSTKPYFEVLEMLPQAPDGTGDSTETFFQSPPVGGFNSDQVPEVHFKISRAQPMDCIDCHDPRSMALRITSPGFMQWIAVLGNRGEPLPHLARIEKWRRGDLKQANDPNQLASRHKMRSFTSAQCHGEYYCDSQNTLEFPWAHGLKTEQLEQHWAEKVFPDGTP
jgi:nitrite reductase (cytochrome c-552)